VARHVPASRQLSRCSFSAIVKSLKTSRAVWHVATSAQSLRVNQVAAAVCSPLAVVPHACISTDGCCRNPQVAVLHTALPPCLDPLKPALMPRSPLQVGELRFVVQPTAECDGDECLLDTPVPPELLAQAPSDGFVPWVRKT